MSAAPTSRFGGPLTFEDLALADLLLQQGHRLGLLVGQKNTAKEAPALKDFGFDFAVAE